MAGLRIEATEEEFNEIKRRLKQLFHINDPNNQRYPAKSRTGMPLYKDGKQVYWWYIRAYIYGKDTIIEQLEAAIQDFLGLSQENAELHSQIRLLRQQLRLDPQPRSYDVVLGNRPEVDDDEF